ncbi:MAG TPA: sugar-binding protein [Gammaproteobacteria bacterium]
MALLGCPAVVLAQAEAPGATTKQLMAARASTPIVVDGRLDEPAWANAAVIESEDLHQILPVEYSMPTQRTRFLVLYDDDALYLAGDMQDDQPELMTAKVLRQGGNNSWLDDQFNIWLDPFNDKRSGYRFQVNPHGVRQEGLARAGDQVQWQWNGIWQAEALQGDDGWSVETRIPFKTISFNPETDVWGLNLNRRVARDNETIGWVSRNRTQSPAISGELTGISGIRQGLGLDIVPSLTAISRRDFSPRADESDVEPSLDVFYKVTPSLNAALTLNTDFSATEVDDRQLNLTRFGLFFPEQRDFFLQDADIFEFGRIGQRSMDSPFARPLEENGLPFFSRRIGLSATGEPVDLAGGGKLSGRAGRWTIGTLAIRQEEFQTVEASDLFVARVAANVLAESSVGFIVTDGDPLSNLDNSVAGVDFRYQNTRLPNGKTLESEAWYQRSSTEALPGDDAAWGIRVWSPNTAQFKGGVGIKEIGASFNPALGFVNRRGIRDYTGELGYTYRPLGSTLRSLYTGANVQHIETLFDGRLQSEVSQLRVELENQTTDKLTLRYQNEKEGVRLPFEIFEGVIIPPGDYSFDQLRAGVSTGPHRRFVTSASYAAGDFYDGDIATVSTSVEWIPQPHFRASISYDYNDVRLPQGDFTLRLERLGLDYIMSAKLSWVNLIQYDNATETTGINSRLHWVPEAGRELFIVLNHNLEDFDRDGVSHSDTADFTIKYRHTFRY